MCGRMTLARGDLDEVAAELDAIYAPEVRDAYRPRFNIAPTDRHIIVRLGPGVEAANAAGARPPEGARWLDVARWGLRAGTKRPLLINARSETAATRAPFRAGLAGRRCIVPADGFYEWGGPPDARQAFWLHRRDGHLLLLAGIYDEVPASDGGEAARQFCVLTTRPNEMVAAIHDRMPVLLDPADATVWLRDGGSALLRPAAASVLAAVPVSARVNSVKNDDPACLAPLPPGAVSAGQLRLF